MRERGYSINDIAQALHRLKSTIGYEVLKRVSGKPYHAGYAKQISYVRMRKNRAVGKRIALDPTLRAFVEQHLMDDQSPDAIAGRLAQVVSDAARISARAIRRYIGSVYGRKIEAHRAKVFRKRWRRRVHKAILAGKRMISKRPKRINARKGLGHMEGDFIVSGRSGSGLVLVLIDRRIRKVLFERILPVSVRNVERALLRMQRRFPEIKTITFDNDILFLEHRRLEKKLGIRIYFCHPRSPWEKPSVENVNRWLRRYIPKSSDISKCTKHFIATLETKANRRFLECLNFNTPDEVYARAQKHKSRRVAG